MVSRSLIQLFGRWQDFQIWWQIIFGTDFLSQWSLTGVIDPISLDTFRLGEYSGNGTSSMNRERREFEWQKEGSEWINCIKRVYKKMEEFGRQRNLFRQDKIIHKTLSKVEAKPKILSYHPLASRFWVCFRCKWSLYEGKTNFGTFTS